MQTLGSAHRGRIGKSEERQEGEVLVGAVLGDELEEGGGEIKLSDAQQQQDLDRVQLGHCGEQQHLNVTHVRRLTIITPAFSVG